MSRRRGHARPKLAPAMTLQPPQPPQPPRSLQIFSELILRAVRALRRSVVVLT
jgi:hypothetical protein